MFVPPDFRYRFTDSLRGNGTDFRVLREERWLRDTEVKYRIVGRNSRWWLTIVFVAISNPYQVRCRLVGSYDSERKALIYARLLQRGIRKDARGTLKVDENAFHICLN
jgi:hypothetical protein